MQTRLTEEAETDETIYEKMTCWCEVTEKEKTASIAAAEATIDESTAAIEENSALSAKLKTEMAKAQDAIDEATGLREEERAEFEAENKELLETIDALTRALEVLGKHNSFLEVKK